MKRMDISYNRGKLKVTSPVNVKLKTADYGGEKRPRIAGKNPHFNNLY